MIAAHSAHPAGSPFALCSMGQSILCRPCGTRSPSFRINLKSSSLSLEESKPRKSLFVVCDALINRGSIFSPSWVNVKVADRLSRACGDRRISCFCSNWLRRRLTAARSTFIRSAMLTGVATPRLICPRTTHSAAGYAMLGKTGQKCRLHRSLQPGNPIPKALKPEILVHFLGHPPSDSTSARGFRVVILRALGAQRERRAGF